MVKKLIEKGSDVNQVDKSDRTPIIYAAIKGHRNIVRLLVNNGARISYTLLRIVKAKIDILADYAREGSEDPYTVADWGNFLDFLIQRGKKQ